MCGVRCVRACMWTCRASKPIHGESRTRNRALHDTTSQRTYNGGEHGMDPALQVMHGASTQQQ